MSVRRLVAGSLLIGIAAAHALSAQQADSARPPSGRFLGRLLNSLDSTPVRSADLRLLFVDSTRMVRSRRGDSLEIFVDTARSRVTVSDSSGAFAVRGLATGHYLIHVRRIGYTPLQAALYVDTGAVQAALSIERSRSSTETDTSRVSTAGCPARSSTAPRFSNEIRSPWPSCFSGTASRAATS